MLVPERLGRVGRLVVKEELCQFENRQPVDGDGQNRLTRALKLCLIWKYTCET